VPELPLNIDLRGLHERFIERKYEICLEEKRKISTTHVFVKEAPKELTKNSVNEHKILFFWTVNFQCGRQK